MPQFRLLFMVTYIIRKLHNFLHADCHSYLQTYMGVPIEGHGVGGGGGDWLVIFLRKQQHTCSKLVVEIRRTLSKTNSRVNRQVTLQSLMDTSRYMYCQTVHLDKSHSFL
uniref:Uncharacterized protein n=1 Tax=Cacopsylla melanoneura TaxID=428564 RepID=A0A8D8VNH9_9HEMI